MILSCRAAFLLKYLGCTQVSILHGGYRAWLTEGLPTTDEVPLSESSIFRLHPNADIMVTTAEMLQAIINPAIIKLDVRVDAKRLVVDIAMNGWG